MISKQATIKQPLLSNGSVNIKRGVMFSVQSVPMAARATMEYVIPPLRNKRTGTGIMLSAQSVLCYE
jgi:hypothetical protein